MGKLARVAAPIAPARNQTVQFTDESGNAIVLSQQDVINYICPTATAQEVQFFMELCRAQRLNPFIKEAYLVKYGSAAASQITAEVVFERRANAHPDYEGIEAGVVYLNRDGEVCRREGTATYKAIGEQLIGGWARVHRRGRIDSYAELALDEYDKRQSSWKTMPGVMIHKCAKAAALRLAFPSDFQGMYIDAEIDNAPTVEELHDVVVGAVVEDVEENVLSDEEKAELRELTNQCVEMGHDESSIAHYLLDKFYEGGMDAAREAATAAMTPQGSDE